MFIRCCCDARLVLGEVDIAVPPGPCDVHFRLPNGHILTLPIEKACELRRSTTAMVGIDRHVEYALKSNDTPLETLRQIPGFREINRAIPIGGKIPR